MLEALRFPDSLARAAQHDATITYTSKGDKRTESYLDLAPPLIKLVLLRCAREAGEAGVYRLSEATSNEKKKPTYMNTRMPCHCSSVTGQVRLKLIAVLLRLFQELGAPKQGDQT